MFGFGSGKAAYPNVYSAVAATSSHVSKETSPPLDSLQPAIDGPPSPERIRAYTEQMKRSSIFGNNSRTNTISSATSSFRSRDSDTVSLSRKSSNRSNASSMPSSRGERPESVQIFGKSIFSRAGRKARREGNTFANSASSFSFGENGSEGRMSARENYYGKESDSRMKQLISGPYNFQHVTHTRPDHVSKLETASRMELVSEFSAIRASQVPTNGELKGIRTQDLHFENFSSEALNSPTGEDWRSQTSTRKERGVLRKSISPPQPQRYVNYAKSVDNLRSPPPRPPRSPLSPTCPVALPARTSSRTASILFETFDPLATTTIERPPPANGGFRRPAPFSIPRQPPSPSWSEPQQTHFSDRPMSHAMTTPGDEAWPLTASIGNFSELADVQEEEEDFPGPRRSRITINSTELRASQSVPSLRLRSYDQETERPETRMSTTLGRSPSNGTMTKKSPLTPEFNFTDDWEKDVDYCYEHELEADCDYQWDRCSVEDNSATVEKLQPFVEQASLDLHLEDDHRSVYHGRCRPSLIVPSAYDIPELSPMSSASNTSDLRTPANFLRPIHARSPSHASSFKESHGFNLSPSLLIPSDYQSQMEQDALYDEHFRNHTTSASIFNPDLYNQAVSPVDESASSTASYRSSNFSRGSARSSSSTRISVTHSRASQDSVMLLSRAASLSQAHRSIGSASSLPDLIPSTIRRSEQVVDSEVAAGVRSLNIAEGDENVEASPAADTAGPSSGFLPLQHRRNKTLVLEPGMRKVVSHSTPQPALAHEVEQQVNLSPVAESFTDSSTEHAEGNTKSLSHERKTSAPVLSPSVKEFKGRARAATSAGTGVVSGKKRGSYTLFPQI